MNEDAKSRRIVRLIWMGIRNGSAAGLEEHRQNIPWTDLFGTLAPSSSVVAALMSGTRDNEDAILRLIACAVEDGHADILCPYTPSAAYKGTTLAKPISALLEKGYNRILSKYLEAGFDPAAKGSDGLSAFDVAELFGNQTAGDLMRSFVARRNIQVALDAASGPTSGPQP